MSTRRPVPTTEQARGGGLQALALAVNSILFDDEPLLYDIYAALVRECLGAELLDQEYSRSPEGLSDCAIVERLVARSGPTRQNRLAESLLGEKIARYRAEVPAWPGITNEARALIALVARRVPVAVGTGAARAEVGAALEVAGLDEAVATIVAEDMHSEGPYREGYETALRRLGRPGPGRLVTVEDSVVAPPAARGGDARRRGSRHCRLRTARRRGNSCDRPTRPRRGGSPPRGTRRDGGDAGARGIAPGEGEEQ